MIFPADNFFWQKNGKSFLSGFVDKLLIFLGFFARRSMDF